MVDDAKYKFLFENDSIVKLNTEQQQHCEGMLTLDECLAALKTFNKNKSQERMASPLSFICGSGMV